jgi:hypothetical protein
MPTAYVIDKRGDEEYRTCIPGGIRINPIGALVLICGEEDGNIVEGRIYAPGEWTQVNIQDEDV